MSERVPRWATDHDFGPGPGPNGIDPIPNAQVYVPRELGEFPPSVTCEIYKDITDAALVSTTSNVDGTFTLGPIPTLAGQEPGTTVQLVAQKGRFRKVVDFTVNAPCSTNDATAMETTLPGANAGQDRVPNIAVVSGDYDQMECVLLNMGLHPESVHMFNGMKGDPFLGGGTPDAEGEFSELLTDASRRKQYNIIFVNCSNNQFEELLDDEAVKSNIEDYVNSGGRLYVTDWSYDYVEQISNFSSIMDFAPTSSDGFQRA